MAAEDWMDLDRWDGFNESDNDPDPRWNRPRRSTLYAKPNQGHDVEIWNGIPVRRMDSDHLMNAILFCERKFVAARDTHFHCHGMESPFYFGTVYDMFPNYKYLKNEWERRKNDA